MLFDQFSCALCHICAQLDADAISSQPSTFDERGATACERIQHPVVFLGVSQHHLMRNLRNEIAPVFGEMRPARITLVHHPQTIGEDVVVLFPAGQVDIVELARLGCGDTGAQSFQIIFCTFECLRFQNLVEFAQHNITAQCDCLTIDIENIVVVVGSKNRFEVSYTRFEIGDACQSEN